MALAGCGKGSEFTQRDRELLLGQGVLSFRQTGLRDIHSALDRFATTAAIQKFEGFDRSVWDFTDPKAGWSFFLNTSVVALGNASGEQPVVAFYHPWSDVYLLTAWQVDQNGPKITDAELLMGDLVRGGDAIPADPSPLWVRAQLFKPLAVGLEAAESIRAFETLYPAKIPGEWRAQIPALKDADLIGGLNYSGVSLMLARNVAEIQDFSRAEPDEDRRLGAIRKQTAAFLEAGANGKLERALKGAGETLPAAREALERIPPHAFAEYRPVSFMLGQDGSVVFLAPTGNAGYFMSCVFKGSGAKQKLARVDLVSYATLYGQAGPKGDT